MTDPYSVLGITPGADDETIKKAYRQKCKQYHPDLHPDDPAAEEHFKEVQAAYSEIMRIKQGGGTAYRQSGQTYGQSNGYSQQYQDPFGGRRLRVRAIRLRLLQHRQLGRAAELWQRRR